MHCIPDPITKASTADDTYRENRDAGVISGAICRQGAQNEGGYDFHLCGGTSSTSTTAASMRHPHHRRPARTNRGARRRRLRTADRQAGCVSLQRAGCTMPSPESPPLSVGESGLHIGGQGAQTQHMMGSLQDCRTSN